MEIAFNLNKNNSIITDNNITKLNKLNDNYLEMSSRGNPNDFITDDIDHEFEIFKNGGYGRKRLRGGASDDDGLIFSEPACNICIGIMKYGYSFGAQVKALREILIEDGIIYDDSTYDDIRQDKRLLKAMAKAISAGLETDISGSRFGCAIVSDFTLYHDMNESVEFHRILQDLNVEIGGETYNRFKKNLVNIKKFVIRIRDNVIFELGLQNTPPKRKASDDNNKSQKKIKNTPETVLQEAKSEMKNIGEEKASKNKTIIHLSDDDEDDKANEADEVNEAVDDSDVLASQLNSVSLNDKKKKKFLGQRNGDSTRVDLDYYPTPQKVLDYLHLVIEHLNEYTLSTFDKPVEKFIIWECAAGDALRITNYLEQRTFKVHSSDVRQIEGVICTDFLQSDRTVLKSTFNIDFDIIITNPPWCKNAEFIKKACSFNVPFVLLMKLDIISRKYFANIVKTQEWKIIIIPITKSNAGFLNTDGKPMQVGSIGWFIFLPNINDRMNTDNDDFSFPILSYSYGDVDGDVDVDEND